jgi:hypothetical protein
MARDRRRAGTRQPARRMPDEVWEPHRVEIETLYQTSTLEGMMDWFRTYRNFEPTYVSPSPPPALFTASSRKQWKDRLSKWGCRKKLDLKTAATVLYLLLQPNELGLICPVLCHNSKYTLTEIDTYIGKSEKVSSREQLLSHLPRREDWHPSIQQLSSPELQTPDQRRSQIVAPESNRLAPDQTLPQAPAELQTHTDAGSIRPVAYDEPQNLREVSATTQNSDQSGMTRLRRPAGYSTWQRMPGQSFSPQDVQAAGQPSSFTAGYPNYALDPSSQGFNPGSQQLHGDGSFLPPSFPYSELVAPLFPYQNEPVMSPTSSTNINVFGSLTPVPIIDESLGDGASQRERAEAVVNHVLDVGEDLDDKPAKRFIQLCIRACIYQGQEYDGPRAQAIEDAANCFKDVVCSFEGYTLSVSILNEVSFLLESFGQAFVKLSIFQSIRALLEIGDDKRQTVLRGSLEFLIETATWSREKAAGMVAAANEMYHAASDSAGRDAPTTISIRYNQAWLLIEGGDYTQAIDILVQEKSRCEMCFGPRALQSVCWVATLARAHFMRNEAVVAEALMTETALTRAKAAFGLQHPIYWDVHWRIGYFLLKMAASNHVRRGLRQEYLDRGETMLYEALVWRAKWLGPDNPQTAKVYGILKDHYQSQGRQSEAANLQGRYRAEAEN